MIAKRKESKTEICLGQLKVKREVRKEYASTHEDRRRRVSCGRWLPSKFIAVVLVLIKEVIVVLVERYLG